MMQRNYYALVAGLPDILPEDKKVVSTSVELREMLKEEVHPSDYQLVELFFLPFDHINLLNLLFKKETEWDDRGNYSREMMEQLQDRKTFEIADLDDVPDYLFDFLERFHGEEQIDDYYKAEQILTEGYFAFLDSSKNEFVKEFTGYRRNIANVMTALNGRKFNTPFDNALIGDDEVASALKKSRTRDFGLTTEISDIEHLIQIFETENLMDREFKLDTHKWEYLDEITFFNYFSIEKVLAFILKLFIVERWMELDPALGKEMFNQLLKGLESGFQFPEEFTLTYGKKK